MSGHDQRFKELIQTFFADFLALFFPEWAERLDAARAEWLTQEVFVEPPQGPRRVLDLVARVPTRVPVPPQRAGEEESWLALVHVEVEAEETSQPVRPRLLDSYVGLRWRYGLPVLPIALFLRVGLEGVGRTTYEERFLDFTPLRFEFLYVGLPALAGEGYLAGDNWLGAALAALMALPPERRAELTAEAMRRLADSPLSDQLRYLLCECVQAYSPMGEAEWQALQTRLMSDQDRSSAMAMTYMQQQFERMRQEGREENARMTLLRSLGTRFGPLAPAAVARVEAMTAEQADELLDRLVAGASTLGDLGLAD